MAHDVEPGRFEDLVVTALDELPEELGRLMRNVAVTVEHGPGPPGLLGSATYSVVNSWAGGVYTQSGQQVTVTNQPYNAAIPAGGSVAVGFTANVSGTNTAPASITCT